MLGVVSDEMIAQHGKLGREQRFAVIGRAAQHVGEARVERQS